MSYPQIAEALRPLDLRVMDPGEFLPDEICVGARWHSPTPLLLQRVSLNPWGGPDETVLLCGNCAQALGVLQCLLAAHQGDLAWPVRREFGNTVRRLGLRGWALHQEALSG